MRVALLGLVFLLAGCQASGGPAGPDPNAVLREAGMAMSKIQTVAADVSFGPGVTFQGFTLASATSKIKLPGDSDSTFKVKQNDFLVDVRVITVGGQIFLKVPFSPVTQLAPDQAASLPDPAQLFDPVKGLPGLLPKARGAASAGSEKVDGVDTDRVNATYAAADVGGALPGITPASDIKASFWIGKKDHLLRRARLAGDLLQAGKPSSVEIHLHDFDAPVEIAKPAAG